MLSILPNQAIGALDNNPDVCGGDYQLPCQRGDVYMLQGLLGPTLGEDRAYGQLINTKWTLGTDFSTGPNNVLTYNGSGSSGVAAVSPLLNMRSNHAYLFNLTVNVLDPGTCSPINGQGIQLLINGTAIQLPGASSPSQGACSSFTLTGFYIPSAINTNTMEITLNNGTIQFTVSDIFVFEYTYPLIEAFDTNGDFIQSIDPILVQYYNYPLSSLNLTPGNPQNFPSLRFDVKFGLDELEDGCYSLQIKDGAGNVANGNFLNSNSWTVGAGWSITNGTASFVGTPFSNALSTSIYLEDNPGPYTLRFFMPTGSGSLIMNLNLSNGGSFTETFTGSGWQEYQFTVEGGYQGPATLSFIPSGIIPGGVLANINIALTNITIDFDEDFTSENILLKTSWSNTPTLLFSANNNDGAFGFDYSQGLTHNLRINAKQDVTSYPETTEVYTFSDNSEALLYGQTQKEYTIFVTDAPVYVHDCLRLLRLHDTFMINGSQYVIDGSYDLNRRKTSALKQSSFTVRDAEGIGNNYRYS